MLWRRARSPWRGEVDAASRNESERFSASGASFFARRCGLQPDRDVRARRPIGGPSGRAQGQAYPLYSYLVVKGGGFTQADAGRSVLSPDRQVRSTMNTRRTEGLLKDWT